MVERLICPVLEGVNKAHKAAQRALQAYTSMRLERLEDSADMVVVARDNDLRALFDDHARARHRRALVALLPPTATCCLLLRCSDVSSNRQRMWHTAYFVCKTLPLIC